MLQLPSSSFPKKRGGEGIVKTNYINNIFIYIFIFNYILINIYIHIIYIYLIYISSQIPLVIPSITNWYGRVLLLTLMVQSILIPQGITECSV
jgi:capsular polysaccharide biosynthesis protein